MPDAEVLGFISRALMAAVFTWSGSDKLRNPQPLAGLLQAHGYKISPAWVRLCGACEMTAAAMLVAGIWVSEACLAYALFVLVANVMVNNFWAKSGPEAAQAKQRAIPSAGMVAGLIYIATAAHAVG